MGMGMCMRTEQYLSPPATLYHFVLLFGVTCEVRTSDVGLTCRIVQQDGVSLGVAAQAQAPAQAPAQAQAQAQARNGLRQEDGRPFGSLCHSL